MSLRLLQDLFEDPAVNDRLVAAYLVSPKDYPGEIFPDGCYHLYDYFFFFRNLQDNVSARAEAYLGSLDIALALGCELYMYGAPYGHAVYDEAPDYKNRIYSFLMRD